MPSDSMLQVHGIWTYCKTVQKPHQMWILCSNWSSLPRLPQKDDRNSHHYAVCKKLGARHTAWARECPIKKEMVEKARRAYLLRPAKFQERTQPQESAHPYESARPQEGTQGRAQERSQERTQDKFRGRTQESTQERASKRALMRAQERAQESDYEQEQEQEQEQNQGQAMETSSNEIVVSTVRRSIRTKGKRKRHKLQRPRSESIATNATTSTL